MGSDSSPISAEKVKRRRLRLLWIRLRLLLPRPLFWVCFIAVIILVVESARRLSDDPSVTELLAQQQQQETREVWQRRYQNADTLSLSHTVGSQQSSSGTFSASVQIPSQSTTPTHSALRLHGPTHSNNITESRRVTSAQGHGSRDIINNLANAHNQRHKAQALKRELRWTIFPLLSRVITEASGAVTGGDSSERNRDRVNEKDRREELVRKIEKWSNKPSSLCFGHGNLTIVTVTVDLPKDYVILMRKNRLHYCTLVHNCRFCDVPVNLDFSRPVAWTKVKAMQLALAFSDTVVHMDADALIVNASISFPLLISSLSKAYNTSKKDVIYTTDFQLGRTAEPTPYSLINTGVYIMHSTDWTKAFLEVQYKLYQSSIFHKFWDQQAVMLYRMKHREEFYEHVALIPYRYMNVPCSHKYNDYVLGDFIVHYAGGHNLQKYERLSKMFFEAYEL